MSWAVTGVMFADADGDGMPDLYITMIFNNPMPELFFRNLGNNKFAEEGVSRRIADFDGGSHGGCWADLDNDGDYDLVNGTTWNDPKYPNHNNIFRNDGSVVTAANVSASRIVVVNAPRGERREH